MDEQVTRIFLLDLKPTSTVPVLALDVNVDNRQRFSKCLTKGWSVAVLWGKKRLLFLNELLLFVLSY